jgi:hypothetical protein
MIFPDINTAYVSYLAHACYEPLELRGIDIAIIDVHEILTCWCSRE